MPLVRLIIFLFRGVGRIFSAIGRFLKALVGAGMRSFLVKSFEVILRLGFVGSLAAVVAVCMNEYAEKPYVPGGSQSVGPPYAYKFDTSNSNIYQEVSLEHLLSDFAPKDAKVPYGPGRLDVEGVIKVWKTQEMLSVSGQKVSWTVGAFSSRPNLGKPMLEEGDFAPNNWRSFTSFFEHAWAIISLPVLLAWLVFPAGSRIIDRIHRACLVAPLCAIVSCSFAYLFARYWLSVQHAATAELVLDLPRWVHPVGILNKSILAGVTISLIPIAVWYLLKWVLGPFLGVASARQNP
jgi:hypothetical protein